MDGFTAALNPSLGLLECCNSSRGENSCLRSRNRVEADGLKPKNEELSCISPCGVGIGFVQDKSGAFFVSTLTPEGVYDLKIIRNMRIMLKIEKHIINIK